MEKMQPNSPDRFVAKRCIPREVSGADDWQGRYRHHALNLEKKVRAFIRTLTQKSGLNGSAFARYETASEST
jgi:hypothetical protein